MITRPYSITPPRPPYGPRTRPPLSLQGSGALAIHGRIDYTQMRHHDLGLHKKPTLSLSYIVVKSNGVDAIQRCSPTVIHTTTHAAHLLEWLFTSGCNDWSTPMYRTFTHVANSTMVKYGRMGSHDLLVQGRWSNDHLPQLLEVSL